MLVSLLLVPQSTCEVGECNGSAIVVHRDSAKLSDSTPLSQVVYVHIEWQTVLQTVDEACAHDEVHTAVTANFLGELAELLQNRAFVLLLKSLALCIGHEAV